MLTEKQRNYIFVVAKQNGWTNEELRKLLWSRYKTEKTSDLTLPNYEWLLQILKTTKPKDYGIF